MYAIYQVNHTILGVGATLALALLDANRWTSERLTPPSTLTARSLMARLSASPVAISCTVKPI